MYVTRISKIRAPKYEEVLLCVFFWFIINMGSHFYVARRDFEVPSSYTTNTLPRKNGLDQLAKKKSMG